MKIPASPAAGLRFVPIAFSIGGLVAMLFISGCATMVPVKSTPAGATVSVDGKPLAGVTPTQYQVENANKEVNVHFSKSGYFDKDVRFKAASSPQGISATLERSSQEASYDITSNPAGATVTLESKTGRGRELGKTPLTGVSLQFTREREGAPWTPLQLTVAKTDYESERITLTSPEITTAPSVTLALLRDEKIYTVTATDEDGKAIDGEALVMLDNVEKGRTPYKLSIPYVRSNKNQEWPKFNLTVEVPTKYKPTKVELKYAGNATNTTIPLKLQRITEITTKIIAPTVMLGTAGAKFSFEEIPGPLLGILNTSDGISAVTDLKAVTAHERQDAPNLRVQMITGFTLTPSGQHVIYASTERNEKKNWVSRLYSKPSLDSSGGVTCLWEDDNMDAQPFMGLDTHDQNIGYLVFTSNRYDREKADICMAEIKEDGVNKPAVTLLSQDKNFNFFPTYGDSNKHIYYLSVQSGVIGADLEVSKVRMAGSSPGRLRFRSLQNDQIYNSDADDRIYIVTLENGKKQISSVTTDGQQRRNLPYPAEFKKADCSQPSVSKDGKRILFVSNRVTSANMRPNNDIYVINEDGTNWQQLTNNESDDSHPMWSPNEEGVVYFLSTRGGATNIWRCKIVAGQ